MSTKRKVNKDNFSSLLVRSMQQAADHAEGKITLKSESLSLPPEPPKYSKNKIKRIREEILAVSQPVFALILGVKPATVKSWERGQNTPNGAIRRLFQLIEKDPEHFLRSISKSKSA